MKKNEMSLVFLGKKDEVYTTSEIIAEYAGVQRRTIDHLLLSHKEDFQEFGVLRFEMRKPPLGSKGGRPSTT